MKKKSPPYAIIGAVVLGLVVIGLFIHWKKVQDDAAAAAVAKAQADAQAAIDAANAKQVAPVVPTPTNMRNVYYATQPIEAGAKISSAFFEKKLTPNEILPDAYTDGTDVVGFYAVRNIEKGDPLTPHNIGKTLPKLSARLGLGMRALALPIFNSDYNNTGGFAVDGDNVDLLYTTLSQDSSYILKTEVLMQNLKILYVPGPKMDSEQIQGVTPAPPPGAPISITFEVTPEQAEALVHMAQVKNGRFSMILRAERDKSEIHFKPFNSDDYIGNFRKIQATTDKSIERVKELAAQIEAQEKNQAGTTNETTHPTQPSP